MSLRDFVYSVGSFVVRNPFLSLGAASAVYDAVDHVAEGRYAEAISTGVLCLLCGSTLDNWKRDDTFRRARKAIEDSERVLRRTRSLD
jgi:hypothetical protein